MGWRHRNRGLAAAETMRRRQVLPFLWILSVVIMINFTLLFYISSCRTKLSWLWGVLPKLPDTFYKGVCDDQWTRDDVMRQYDVMRGTRTRMTALREVRYKDGGWIMDDGVYLLDKDGTKYGYNRSNEFISLQKGSIGALPSLQHVWYSPFNRTVPHFASQDDRELFFKNPSNLEDLKPTRREKLHGVIEIVDNATFDLPFDCGWKSDVNLLQHQKKPKHRYKTLCPLIIPEASSFQHFIDGALPKLMQAYHLLIRPEVKLLIQIPRDTNVISMIRAVGIRPQQIVFYEPGGYHADHMIFTCIAPPIHPSLWQLARRKLRAPEVLPVPSDQAHVVLLTRAKSYNGGRNIANVDAVKSYLRHRYKRKFILFKGGYSLEESIEIFGKAKVLIGVHGGAFYNMNFSPSNINIIEVMPTDKNGNIEPSTVAHKIIWQMADMLGQAYTRICATPLNDLGDIILDLEKLSSVLDIIDPLSTADEDDNYI